MIWSLLESLHVDASGAKAKPASKWTVDTSYLSVVSDKDLVDDTEDQAQLLQDTKLKLQVTIAFCMKSVSFDGAHPRFAVVVLIPIDHIYM